MSQLFQRPKFATLAISKIDVHCHYLPPFYREALAENGHSRPDGMPSIPQWSVEEHLGLMSDLNISKSILSISSPGTNLSADANDTIALTRRCNAYAADLQKQYPTKFGFWASLPLPHVEATLRELDVALAEGAAGFVLMTNYNGHYLGDAIFEPVFSRLNERGATVFVHATRPCMRMRTRASPGPDPDRTDGAAQTLHQPATPLAAAYADPMMEFLFDTARAVANLLLRGTAQRNAGLRFIVPEAAGAFPPLLTRITLFGALAADEGDGGAAGAAGAAAPALTEGEAGELLNSRFWFDLAGAVFPGQLRGMMQTMDVGRERLLYGSDFPFAAADGVKMLGKKLDAGLWELLGRKGVEAVYSRNATRLLGLQ